MNRRSFTIGFGALVAGACARRAPEPAVSGGQRRSVRGDLVFITRDGCVNTPDMQLNLDDALRGLGLALDYEVIDLGKLPKADARTGYPTPTILYRNRDLFDMPAHVPPYPEPS
jgi:hypothetical protein